MSIVIHNNPFNAYTIRYYTRHDIVAIFSCMQDKNFMGAIYFMDANVPLPPAELQSDGSIHLYYYEKSIDTVLHILQSEKPLELYINTSVKNGWLQSGTEPVGEEES